MIKTIAKSLGIEEIKVDVPMQSMGGFLHLYPESKLFLLIPELIEAYLKKTSRETNCFCQGILRRRRGFPFNVRGAVSDRLHDSASNQSLRKRDHQFVSVSILTMFSSPLFSRRTF